MIDIVGSPYLGEKAAEHADEIIARLQKERPAWNCFVLTFSDTPGNLLEFTPSWVFLQPYFKKRHFRAIGLAEGKEEAIAVMARILMDCYEATGHFDVRSFFEGRGD